MGDLVRALGRELVLNLVRGLDEEPGEGSGWDNLLLETGDDFLLETATPEVLILE